MELTQFLRLFLNTLTVVILCIDNASIIVINQIESLTINTLKMHVISEIMLFDV